MSANRTRIKKIAFALCIIALCYGAMELVSSGIYFMAFGKPYSRSDIKAARMVATDELKSIDKNAENTNGRLSQWDVPHPYLGFVYNKGDNFKDDPQMTAAGLRADIDPLVASRDSNNAIVAITGGSVSEQLYLLSHDLLRDRLQKIPAFHNKNIVLIMLGRSAYAQPQQAICVLYYLLQGGRLDILINLDGFNESYNAIKNHYDKIYPAFPLYWKMFLMQPDSGPPKLGMVVLWQQFRYTLLQLTANTSFSVTISTFWRMIDAYTSQQILAKTYTLFASSKLPFFITGPRMMDNATNADLATFAAGFWERGSEQLALMAKANGFQYFHFLQPNQYDTGSKPLSREERRTTILPADTAEASCVVNAYPTFRKIIPRLQAKGINAYDLTGIFKNHPETLYKDTCCHVNVKGSDIIANAIADKVVAGYK